MILLKKDYLGLKAMQKKQKQATFTPPSSCHNIQRSHCLTRSVGLRITEATLGPVQLRSTVAQGVSVQILLKSPERSLASSVHLPCPT